MVRKDFVKELLLFTPLQFTLDGSHAHIWEASVQLM